MLNFVLEEFLVFFIINKNLVILFKVYTRKYINKIIHIFFSPDFTSIEMFLALRMFVMQLVFCVEKKQRAFTILPQEKKLNY